MKMSVYTQTELTRNARSLCKGLGRYKRWEVEVRENAPVTLRLVVYYRDKDGNEQTTTMAL